MPLRNRVRPDGEIVTVAARGLFMGNRGCLHDGARQVVRSVTSQRFWITCELAFKGRRRSLMTPGHYTELFFLDEAVALSAGHRPCAECRRPAYGAFLDAWVRAFGVPRPRAPEMDAVLDAARIERRTGAKVLHRAQLGALPDGVFLRLPAGPALWWQDRLHPYRADGYVAPLNPDQAAIVDVLTPKPVVAVLAAGYRPVLHPCLTP